MIKRDNIVKKNFLYNAVGSTVNASISLIFMIIVTRINGTDKAGIFTFAFSTSCLFQVIGLFAGRAYQVTETNKNYKNKVFVYNRIISCILMFVASVLFVVIRGYNFYKCSIIVLLIMYKMVEAFSEVLYGIIQKNDELYKVGISLFLKGILSVASFLILDIFTKNIELSILSIIFVNILIIIFYDFKNAEIINVLKEKINNKFVFLIFKFGFFTFLLTILTQYIINASKYAIDGNMSNESQTIFGIILMPATLVILCGQFLIHPFLNKLTQLLKEKRYKEFKNIVCKLVVAIFIFGIIIDIIAYLIGIPFLELIYGISLKKYKIDLIIIITGAVFFGMSYIFSNALIAARNTFIQALIFIITSLFALVDSNLLVSKQGIYGASISYMLSMLLLLVLFIISFLFVSKRKEGN